MKVDDTLVDHLAELAKLEFPEGEKERIRSDLTNIISFVDKLRELNTDGVEPLIHMTDRSNVLREDRVVMEIDHGDALRNAPMADSDYFKVPKVLKKQ